MVQLPTLCLDGNALYQLIALNISTIKVPKKKCSEGRDRE